MTLDNQPIQKKSSLPNDQLPPYTAPLAQPDSNCTHSSAATAAFAYLNISERSAKPTSDQCLAHLKLLEAFHQLRENVATTDGLYGIHDHFVDSIYPGDASQTKRTEILLKIREKRWAIYVFKAARRYENWWQKTTPTDASMPTQNTILSARHKLGQDHLKYYVNPLPPLGQSLTR